VYVGSPYYAGYADPTYEMYKSIHEPGSYRCAFGFKAAVEKQINGDPLYKYSDPGKIVPYITWGPYLWTDGIKPRNYDSLYWDCEADFRADGGGFHLNGEGKDKLAELLNDFFKTDTLSEIFYNDGPKWVSCGDGRYADGNIYTLAETTNESVQLYPTVNQGIFSLELPTSENTYLLNVYDNVGRIVYTEVLNDIEITNIQLSSVPNGLYFVEISNGLERVVKTCIVNR
jgi:hypothetical protein